MNLQAFDLAEMNTRLNKLPLVYRKSYEQRIVPSDAMIRYIERR